MQTYKRNQVLNNFKKTLLFPRYTVDALVYTFKYFCFTQLFTKYASLNKGSRRVIFEQYQVLCKERSITLDLSGTTKILKKLPRHVAKRLNYIGVKMRQDSRMDRVN